MNVQINIRNSRQRTTFAALFQEMEKTEVKPYSEKESGKKQQVEEMFDNISPRYDALNHILSLNIDKNWRKKVVKKAAAEHPKKILDVATGTADLAIALAKANPEKIVGIDISQGMLDVGAKKIREKNLDGLISLQKADSENLPFEDGSFDVVTVAFGVRNFENLSKGLKELNRVLKKGGKLLVLEFSQPQKFPFKQGYNFYFKNILPLIGKIVSKDDAAYTYLPASVGAFPFGEKFIQEMATAGFSKNKFQPVTFGVASIYEGIK